MRLPRRRGQKKVPKGSSRYVYIYIYIYIYIYAYAYANVDIYIYIYWHGLLYIHDIPTSIAGDSVQRALGTCFVWSWRIFSAGSRSSRSNWCPSNGSSRRCGRRGVPLEIPPRASSINGGTPKSWTIQEKPWENSFNHKTWSFSRGVPQNRWFLSS